MEVPELNLKECESVFVRDDFYENIQAPKFHDFCSNEDPVVDAEAYFRRLGGRSPRPSADTFTDQNAFKGTKESTVLKPPGLPKAPLSSVTLNADVTSSLPKASSAGLKKAKSAVPMLATSLTKSQDKAPSKNKMYQRVNPVSNASLSSTASDGKGIDSVLPLSTVNSYHATENTDPNGPSQAKRKAINIGSPKCDEGTMITETAGPMSVQAPTLTEGKSKVANESQVHLKSQSQIPRPSKEKPESTGRRVIDPPGAEPSDGKDRKRKPTPRSAELGAGKVYETRSRVLKQQRKSSTLSDSDACSVVSDLGPSSFQCNRTNSSELVRASTVNPPAEKRTSRRSSDNSRRQKTSGGPNARQGRRVLTTGRKRNANAAEAMTGDVAVQLSFSQPLQFGSNPPNEQISVTEQQNFVADGDIVPKLMSVTAFVSSGSMVTSSSVVRVTEDSSLLNPSSGRASDCEDSTLESVQTVPCVQDTPKTSGQLEVHDDSVGNLLVEKLQNLHLQQDDSEALQEPEPNNAQEAVQLLSCVIISDDSVSVEAAKGSNGDQIDGTEKNTEELTAADNSNTVGAGVSSCTGINLAEAESGLDASDEFSVSSVVPSEGEIEHDATVSFRSQDIDLSTDSSALNACQATTVSGECTVAEIDEADVIESLQNLQIQPDGSGMAESKLPCQEVAGAAISRDSFPAIEEHFSNFRAAGNDKEMFKSHSGIPSVNCKTVVGSSQEVKTGNETRFLKRLFSKGLSSEAHYTESDVGSSKGPHFFFNEQQKRNNKRKSIELGPQRNEQGSMITSAVHNVYEQRKAKASSQTLLAPLTHSQLSSSVSRVTVASGISGQHKKMKATCPQPFRLRTEERGALKEVEFNKKVELYLAAKEKMQNVPFQFTTNKDSRVLNQNTVKPPKSLSKDTKTSMKQIHQYTQARAAERALFDMKVTEKSIRADEEKQEKEKRIQLEAEEEIKRMRKQMIPHAQRMPFFDRPFKPQRSTKTLTVPSSPKFHSLKTKRTCARTSTQE